MPRSKTRKRPCKICRRWFLPDVRHKDRQNTCGNPECRKEWHRKQCETWNKKNSSYFKSDYLAKKLAQIKDPPPDPNNLPVKNAPKAFIPPSRIELHLPRDVIKDAIGAKQLVIIEYIAQLILRKSQEAIRSQSFIDYKNA